LRKVPKVDDLSQSFLIEKLFNLQQFLGQLVVSLEALTPFANLQILAGHLRWKSLVKLRSES
jgi:hypothetical protein